MSTLRQVIDKSVEVRDKSLRVEELVEKRLALQGQLAPINVALIDARAARDAAVDELKVLVGELE